MAVTTELLYFDAMSCGECQVHFALERTHRNKLIGNGKTFYCPNGHARHYGESELDKKNAKILRLQSTIDFKDKRIARLAERVDEACKETVVHKGRATRFKNDRDKIKTRVSNGACPCCKRSFKKLRDHMTTRHPGYALTVDE